MAARSTLPNLRYPIRSGKTSRNDSPGRQRLRRSNRFNASPSSGQNQPRAGAATARFRNPIGGRIPATPRYSRFVIASPVMPGPRPRVRPKVNLQGILAEAIKGDCKSSFSNVSAVLAERFGSRKAKKMASELTGSTFVPALRSAVLDVRKQQKAARRQQQRATGRCHRTASSACPGLATAAAGKCPRPGPRGGRKSSRTTARGPAT
jgi:hypothetical protein